MVATAAGGAVAGYLAAVGLEEGAAIRIDYGGLVYLRGLLDPAT